MGIRCNLSMPTLYIFSGLPGTGKSTLAALLCKHLGASYIRVDTIEQSLKDICDLDVDTQGYDLAYRVASDNLNQGLDVVGDSCNSVRESRKGWEYAAINASAQYINIEVRCSDKREHQTRVESRASQVKGLELPTWKSVKERFFHPWDSTVISIDTAGQCPEQSIKQLLVKLDE